VARKLNIVFRPEGLAGRTRLGIPKPAVKAWQTTRVKLNDTNVVMVHGAGGGAWEWRRWESIFRRAGLRVISRDLQPGVRGLAATSFDDYLDQTISWFSGIEGPVVMVGASLGGLLALCACGAVRPSALILVNSVPPQGLPQASDETGNVIRWSESSFEDTERAMPDCSVRSRVYAHARWRDESGSVVREARCGRLVERPDCPVLVIAGELDSDMPFSSSLRMQEWLGAELYVCKGASHLGPLLGRSALGAAKYAVSWLESVGSG
jgi:pimeloyl-ACP methyl ester carboxylesterase